MRNFLLGLGLFVCVSITSSSQAFGQETEKPPINRPAESHFGPPKWVIESWENGEDPRVKYAASGPPWLFRFDNDSAGGPPAEVTEAWENGEHPRAQRERFGPPSFILELCWKVFILFW